MSKQYTIEKVEVGEAWDRFIMSTLDGAVFAHSKYLANSGCRAGTYHCYNSGEIRAAVVLVESDDGTAVVLDDLVIYSGIYFGAPTYGQNPSQQLSEHFELASFIAEWMAGNYSAIEFALSPSVADIRPFLWFNYGQDTGRYRVDVRYTSVLEIGDFAIAEKLEDVAAYALCSSARRQQIRYARRDGVVTEEFSEVGLFADFYLQTMVRQGERVPPKKMDNIVNLVQALLMNGMARMFVSRDHHGVPGSAAVYAIDRHQAYYLFGANNPNLRNTPTGTAVLWDAFTQLAKGGVTLIDLEGVNSPRRGWFKLSFGGNLIPYYQITLNR